MIRLHGLMRLSSLFVAMATASAAHALGVGEVSLNSRLNQPLDAKIALFEASGLDSNEVTVRLASPEAFERVGLDRPFFLTDLKFSPTLQGAQGNIIVTSSKPVREPYLSFLIEVIWPNGRMLREYTLLLDPPIYAPAQPNIASTPAQTAPVQPPVTAVAKEAVAATPTPPAQQQAARTAPPPEPAVAKPPVQPEQPKRAATPEPAQAKSGAVLPSGQYQTQSNDTLWEIAKNYGTPGTSVYQTMLAIQDINPDAFINDNINLLKKGQILRLPDDKQVNSRTAAVAVREFVQQNTAWSENRAQTASAQAAQRQINATGRGAASTSRGQEPNDNLRLVSAASEGRSALNERLAAAQENLDSSRRENEELKSRLGDLEAQLEKLQRLVELKDTSLANLQAQLANQDANSNTSNAVAYPTESQVEGDTSEDFSSTAPEFSSTTFADETAANDNVEQAQQPVVASTPNTPSEASSSWWERWLDSPMLVWGAGGLALLLVLLLLMGQSRRNARKWAERELEAELAAEETKHESDFASGLDLPDSNFNDLLLDEPLQQQEQSLSAHHNEEVSLDPFLMTDEPLQATDKNSSLALDDFADFDLKFDAQPKMDKSLPLVDLSEELSFEPAHEVKSNDLPSLSTADTFDFTAKDKAQSFKEPVFDDFDLKDKAPLAEPASEALGDLDFSQMDEITSPSPKVAEEPPPFKQRPVEGIKAADDDFDFLSGTDETETKLDLARAYIDMGDMEGARDILDEVMSEGSDSQRSEARELMTSLA